MNRLIEFVGIAQNTLASARGSADPQYPERKRAGIGRMAEAQYPERKRAGIGRLAEVVPSIADF